MEDIKKYTFIPIGLNCFSSGFLKHLGLRKCSFLLDWLQLFNIENLLNILNKDLSLLIDRNNIISGEEPCKEKELCKHKIYGNIFVHHCPLTNYFERCLDRFNKRDKTNNIFILRLDIEKDYYKILETLNKHSNNCKLFILKIISIEKQEIPNNDVFIENVSENIILFKINLKTTNKVGSLIQDKQSLHNLSSKFISLFEKKSNQENLIF